MVGGWRLWEIYLVGCCGWTRFFVDSTTSLVRTELCDSINSKITVGMDGNARNILKSTVRSLRVIYTNARSIRNKINDLKALIASEIVDIIAITESWIKSSSDFIGEFSLPGYKIFSKERKNKKGGGVLLYVREFLNVEEVILNDNDFNIEILSVNIKHEKQKINFTVVYRPPSQNSSIDIKMYEILTKLIGKRPAVLVGDFNCPELSEPKTPQRSETKLLLNFIQDNFLYQKIKDATRNNNILDLVLTSHASLVDDLTVGESLGNSDHNIVRLRVNMESDVPSNNMRVPNFYRADFKLFQEKISNINWDILDEVNEVTVNEEWEFFKNKIKEIEQETVPFKIRRNPMGIAKPKWFNNNIKKLIHNRTKAYKAYKREKTHNNEQIYVDSRRQVKRAIRQAKKEYEVMIARDCKENPKRFYDYVTNRKPLREKVGQLLCDSGELAVSNHEVAETLNKYFSSVFTIENNKEAPTAIQMRTFCESEKLTSIQITEKDVAKYISKLNITKSPGPDNLYPRVLKELKENVTLPLTKIFNSSLKRAEVPKDFKLANITPIFKKGDRKLASNYRPISLTSVACKIMESIIRDEIVKHLDKYNLIKDSQHGFRRNRSCLTNLLHFYNQLIEQYDEHGAVDVIYLDYSKAFDVIPHKKLIIKLKAHGIDGEVLLWIEDWLRDREQRVVINGESSGNTAVTSGVPQGSVLGPLLFIIYVNDLDIDITNTISKFADDTKIGGAANSESIQSDLDKIAKWSKSWGMNFNVNKCNVLHVGKTNIRSTYFMSGRALTATDVQRDLGVVISDDFKFTKQCIEACKKANKVLGFIYRNFDHKSKDIILPLYKSLVRPHLEYAIQFWNPYFVKDIEILEQVQKRATKLIPGMRTIPYEMRLKILGLQTLKTRRLRGDLLEVFKILNNYENLNYEDLFTLNNDGRTRNNGFKLRVKRFKSNIAKNFFTYRIANDWNTLPAEVVNSTSINMFKNRIDKYFKSQGII
jgi:hypothetical protein